MTKTDSHMRISALYAHTPHTLRLHPHSHSFPRPIFALYINLNLVLMLKETHA